MIDLSIDVSIRQESFVLHVSDRARVEVLGLFGPSGAGKTTLLEAVAGLRSVEHGEIRVGDRVLFSAAGSVNLPPRKRRIGYVPQDALLFPHLDVRANLLYGAKRRGSLFDHQSGGPGWGQPSGSVARANPGRYAIAGDGPGRGAVGQQRPLDLRDITEILEISALLDRRVQALSGGERQRVAIGRALMTHPMLLLLDEPLAGVDRPRRERILPYLLRIRRELHVPLIYVTHDKEELRQIADRVLVIEDGQLVRAGAPADLMW